MGWTRLAGRGTGVQRHTPHPTTRVDKEPFKQLFYAHWEAFWQRDGHHLRPEVVEKMLGCGNPARGYRTLSVWALPGREAGGIELQEQLVSVVLQGVHRPVGES